MRKGERNGKRRSHKEKMIEDSGLKKTKMGILGHLATDYIQILADLKVQLKL